MTAVQHQPVLKTEVLVALNLKANYSVVDCTVGAGGHAEGILQQTEPEGQLLGLDIDPTALSLAANRLQAFAERVILANTNFDRLAEIITHAPFSAQQPFGPIQAILVDLGVSSMQLDQPSRGFSFQQDGPLDMRLGPSAQQSAAELINNLSEKALADLIYQYGEERKSRRIAQAIVQARPLYTTQALANVVSQAVGGRRRQRIHPATRTFQAIRIAVNDELGTLKRFLPQALKLLVPGGRLAIISFHSLEDRIVKHFFRQTAGYVSTSEPIPFQPHQGRVAEAATINILTKKPIVASDEEISVNPRARSAKLRVVEIKQRKQTRS